LDRGSQVLDLNLNAIPAAGARHSTIGHGLPGTAGTGAIEQQLQIASGEGGEAGRRVHVDLEAEVLG
jgi:hypothetical protein